VRRRSEGPEPLLRVVVGNKKPYNFWLLRLRKCKGFFAAGRFVAYTSNTSGKFEVDVKTFPRSDHIWPISTNGEYEPRWRPDVREIYYLSDNRKVMAVSVGAGPTFGPPVTLFQTRTPAGVSPTVRNMSRARWQTLPGEHAHRRPVSRELPNGPKCGIRVVGTFAAMRHVLILYVCLQGEIPHVEYRFEMFANGSDS